MNTFARPTEPTLVAERVPVDRTCSHCAGGHIRAYRVLGEGGWWDVVKCADCLESLERTRAPRLGLFTPVVSKTERSGVDNVRR